MTTCIWQQVCAALEATLSKPALGLLLPGLELASVDGQCVTLRARSGFLREMVIRKFLAPFQAAFTSVLGFEPVFSWEISEIQKPLNNLNKNIYINLNNLNNLNSRSSLDLKNLTRESVKRLELYTDDTLKKCMGWDVQEWFVQVCIRDYGLQAVKRTINRIGNLPEGYFKPGYGPINQQRGKLFNTEMRKLKEQREARSVAG